MGIMLDVANAVLDLLRGVSVTAPGRFWASLHTGDPGDDGANEVSTGDWPSYARVDPAGGGAVATGFDAAAARSIKNAQDMLYARLDADGPVTCSWVVLWNAETGGDPWFKARIVDSAGNPTTKTFSRDDECVIKAGELELVLADDDPGA